MAESQYGSACTAGRCASLADCCSLLVCPEEVLPAKRLQIAGGHRGKIRVFGNPYLRRHCRVVPLQICRQKLHRAALPRGVTDQNDLLG